MHFEHLGLSSHLALMRVKDVEAALNFELQSLLRKLNKVHSIQIDLKVADSSFYGGSHLAFTVAVHSGVTPWFLVPTSPSSSVSQSEEEATSMTAMSLEC